MSKIYTLSSGYYIIEKKKGSSVNTDDYSTDLFLDTVGGFDDLNITKNLPGDIDIFTELPQTLFTMPQIGEFLNCMKNEILKYANEEITLSKLRIGEHSDSTTMLEWIFNYFRVYYSFDCEGENSYGMIENNPSLKRFSTICESFSDDYKAVVEDTIRFVMEKL